MTRSARGAQPAGYSGTPLPKRLGVKPGATLVLVGAPADFAATLGELPDGARIRRDARARGERVVLFAGSRAELAKRFPAAARAVADGGSLWLAWPKKSSGVTTDITEDTIRQIALPMGLVDVKVCAVDDTWSGLKLVIRKDRRAAHRATGESGPGALPEGRR